MSKTLAQNSALSVTLFAFDKGEEISTHESGGDAMVTCLDGTGKITIDGVEYILHEGDRTSACCIRRGKIQNAFDGCILKGTANSTKPPLDSRGGRFYVCVIYMHLQSNPNYFLL